MGLLCGMMDIPKQKKKRKAKWRSCSWCERRNLDPPFRSGKGKVLVRHMVECEALYRLEQSTQQNRPKADVMFAMMRDMQSQIADLTARVSVVEQRKARKPDPGSFWSKINAKQAWRTRKDNTVRAIRACLKSYEPSKWVKTPFDYLEMMLLTKQPDICDILSIALWPIIEPRGHKMCLMGYDSENEYHIFKNVWGKTRSTGNNLDFFEEALREVGLPMDRFFDKRHIYQVRQEFDRILMRFQTTKVRSGNQVPQGLVGLCKQWRKVYPLPDTILEACTSLGPEQELKWETEAPPGPRPLESEEVHAESKSASGPQSSSETHGDSFEVV